MSKKYVVAEGFAFTSGGIILNEGDEITAENFGGNEDVFNAAIADKKIIESSELAVEKKEGEGDKSSGKNPLEKLSKKELEDLAVKLNLETEGKKKEEVVTSVKTFIDEYLGKSAEASEEQIKEFAVIFGLEVEGKTKDEVVTALNDLQK